MKSSAVEIWVGAFVLLVAGGFLAYAYTQSDFEQTRGGYSLYADFGRIDGVSAGSDIRISGVKIGTVGEPSLVENTYQARVELKIAGDVAVPEDSAAKISFDGLLGGSYVSIEPGGSEDMLADGDSIEYTQGSIDIIGVATRAFLNNDDSE